MGNGIPDSNTTPIRTQPVEQFNDNSNNAEPLEEQQSNDNRTTVGQMNGNPYIGQPNIHLEKERQKQERREKRRLRTPKALRDFGKGAAAFGKAYAAPAAKYVGKKALKGGIRTVSAATIGAVGGTIGLAAGLATDDMTNVFKYGAAGVAGGAVAGDVIAKNVENGIPRAIGAIAQKGSAAHDNYEREKDTPDEYKQYQNEKADREYMNIRKNKTDYNKFVEAFGKDNAKQMMEGSLEYRQKAGITDTDLIIKAMKLDSGEIGHTAATSKERIAAAKLATSVQSAKDVESMEKRLAKKGYDQKLISQNMEAVRKLRGLENN